MRSGIVHSALKFASPESPFASVRACIFHQLRQHRHQRVVTKWFPAHGALPLLKLFAAFSAKVVSARMQNSKWEARLEADRALKLVADRDVEAHGYAALVHFAFRIVPRGKDARQIPLVLFSDRCDSVHENSQGNLRQLRRCHMFRGRMGRTCAMLFSCEPPLSC